jgi:uracil-DNA glycosylase
MFALVAEPEFSREVPGLTQMRQALEALTEELRRLKTVGVKTIAVSDESVAALRRLVAERGLGRSERNASMESSNASDPAVVATTPA